MNKNIFYLKNLLDNIYFRNDFDIIYLKSFFSNYLTKFNIEDSNFLKLFDITNHKVNLYNVDFNYRDYIDFDVSDYSFFVFLNNKFLFSHNVECIKFNILDCLDKLNTLEYIFDFNKKYIENNLDLFSFINILLSEVVYSFDILEKCHKNNFFIFNFYLDDLAPNSFFTRFYFNISPYINLNLFEYFFNLSNKSFFSSMSCINISDNSSVNHFSINEGLNNNFGAHYFYSNLNYKSSHAYSNHVFNYNTFKSNFYINLLGSYSNFKSNFIRFLKSKNFDDTFVKVSHINTYSFSRVIFKSACADRSSSNFYGLIDVGFNINNVDSGLLSKGLSLDDTVSLKMIPELAIKNYDVKCSHGATIGFIDDDLIFYISSRGFSKNECINLLINAFFSDIIYDYNNIFDNFLFLLFNKYYVF